MLSNCVLISVKSSSRSLIRHSTKSVSARVPTVRERDDQGAALPVLHHALEFALAAVPFLAGQPPPRRVDLEKR